MAKMSNNDMIHDCAYIYIYIYNKCMVITHPELSALQWIVPIRLATDRIDESQVVGSLDRLKRKIRGFQKLRITCATSAPEKIVKGASKNPTE